MRFLLLYRLLIKQGGKNNEKNQKSSVIGTYALHGF